MCEEGSRYQKKDDFKVCQQKTARTSKPCTASYSTSCVFINAPPAIRPHLAQLQNNDLKHSFNYFSSATFALQQLSGQTILTPLPPLIGRSSQTEQQVGGALCSHK